MYNNGDKLWLDAEKKPYKIRACDERYLICTKPFNPKRTVLYTIIDLEEEIRGTENLVFGMGFGTDQDCNEALERLNDTVNPSEISHRNRVNLRIIRVEPKMSKDEMHTVMMSHLELIDSLVALKNMHEDQIELLQEDLDSLTEALKVAIELL